MTDTITTTAATAISLTPPASKESVIAEYIGCILAGRPFPYAGTMTTPPCPATTAEGIERILRARA